MSDYSASDPQNELSGAPARLWTQTIPEGATFVRMAYCDRDDAQVEAAARALLPLLDPTWPYYDYEEIAHEWLPEPRRKFNEAIRTALRAAKSVRDERSEYAACSNPAGFEAAHAKYMEREDAEYGLLVEELEAANARIVELEARVDELENDDIYYGDDL